MVCWISSRAAALIVFVACLIAVSSITAKAQQSEDTKTLAQLQQLCDAGKCAEATDIAQRELAQAERQLGSDHTKVAAALRILAFLYYRQDREGEAEPLTKRALAIDENAFGPDHPSVRRDLGALAFLYSVQGRLGEAEPLHKRGLEIAEKALGPDHPDVAEELSYLSTLYYNQRRYAEVEPLFKRALAIYEKVFGPDDLRVGANLETRVRWRKRARKRTLIIRTNHNHYPAASKRCRRFCWVFVQYPFVSLGTRENTQVHRRHLGRVAPPRANHRTRNVLCGKRLRTVVLFLLGAVAPPGERLIYPH